MPPALPVNICSPLSGAEVDPADFCGIIMSTANISPQVSGPLIWHLVWVGKGGLRKLPLLTPVCWRPSRPLFLFWEGVKWRVWVLKYRLSTWVRWWFWTLRGMKWWNGERGGGRKRGRNEVVERWVLEMGTDRGESDVKNVNEHM